MVSQAKGNFSIEDITLTVDNRAIIASDQAHDALIIYDFNPNTGFINPQHRSIQDPTGCLSFPHGVSASPDGNWIVAANYGDDSFNLYRINH